MDFDTVCQRSELASEIVRFYVNEGLVKPLFSPNRLADDAEYAEEDVQRLSAAASLVRLQFSLDDIRQILNDEASLAEILPRHRAIVAQRQADDLERLKLLDALQTRPDHVSLLEQLAQMPERFKLEDLTHSRLDQRARAERERRLQGELDELTYELTQVQQQSRKWHVLLYIAAIIIAVLLGWIFIPYFL